MDHKAILAEAERQANAGGRYSPAWEAGWIRSAVRELCARIAHMRTAEGIAQSIAALPERHDDLRTVLAAVLDRAEAADTERSGLEGMGAVVDALHDALGALAEVYVRDPAEEAAARIEWEYDRACKQRAELRHCALYAREI